MDTSRSLIRKGGVYFVKAQTVNACVRADGCTQKTREYNLMGDQKSHVYKPTGAQKTHEYSLMGDQENDAHKQTDAQKTRGEYELMNAQKTRGEYELMSAQKNDAYKVTRSQKNSW